MYNMSGTEVFRTADMIIGSGPRPHVKVSLDNYPGLYRALVAICHDNGYGANHPVIYVSESWQDRFASADKALDELYSSNSDDFDDFTIGDQDIADEIAARSPELAAAGELLEDFFGENGSEEGIEQ